MKLEKKLIPYLIMSAVLCTSCTSIEDSTDLQTTESTLGESSTDTTEDTTTVDSNITSTDTTTSDLTTTITTSETVTTLVTTTTEDVTTTVTTEQSTTVTTTTTPVTTSETETTTNTTTTEQPSEEVQLTPEEMLQEMVDSKANLNITYMDENGDTYSNTIEYSELENIRQYLEGCNYAPDNQYRQNPNKNYVSITLEFEDLFGNLSCRETFTIYDVTQEAFISGNCWVTVDIYDPNSAMYYSSSENYTTDVTDIQGLMDTVFRMVYLGTVE